VLTTTALSRSPATHHPLLPRLHPPAARRLLVPLLRLGRRRRLQSRNLPFLSSRPPSVRLPVRRRCASSLHLLGLDRPRGPRARTSLRQPEIYEREMAEATKIAQDAAKATITLIENSTTRGSSAAMHKADEVENEYKHVAVKTATARGAASVEAGGRGDKRKAREALLTVGVARKVAKLAKAAKDGRADVVVKNSKQSPRGDSSLDAGGVVAVKSAKDGAGADVAEMEALYHFPAGDFSRALEAVDVLGRQWTTRRQRSALRGATPKQRAVAFLLAERLFAAKMLQWAADELYLDEGRNYRLVQKGMEASGPHGMDYVNCKAIKKAYKSPGQAVVMAALAAEARPDGASGARAVAAKGKVKAVSASEGGQGAGVGQVVTGPEGALSRKGKVKALPALVGARGKGAGEVAASTGGGPSTVNGKGKAVSASAATDDDDEVVIVKVILANEQDQTRSATAGGAARTTARVLARVSAAASAAGVLGYTDDEVESDQDDGQEEDEWDGNE